MAMRHITAKNADVRRVWADEELLLPEAAAILSMSVDCLRDRATGLCLPQRSTGRREVIRPRQVPEFRLMWRAGVSARLMGQHFGCSYFAIINTAARLELEARGVGFAPKMTLEAYLEARLGISMRLRAQSDHALAKTKAGA
jgi:hypothetical protein